MSFDARNWETDASEGGDHEYLLEEHGHQRFVQQREQLGAGRGPRSRRVAELTTSGVRATVGSPDTVLGLNVVSGATVDITTSAFTATEGTAQGANHGLIRG